MSRQKDHMNGAAEEVDEGWIWGSSRGGGGAPLKDKSGSNITNLKLVINGDIEADHSPTGSPDRQYDDRRDRNDRRDRQRYRDNNYDDDEDYHRGRDRRNPNRDKDRYDDRSGRRNGRDEDDRADQNRGNGRGGGGSGRKLAFNLKNNSDSDEDYRAPRGNHKHDSNDRNGRNANSNKDDYEESTRNRRRSPQGRRVSSNDSPSHIPGLSGLSSPSSDRKFMGAIKEMHSSDDPLKREVKVKKELDYQSMLKLQIDEKKYHKDLEEHKDKALKQKELEEYLAVHYKGKVPPHVSQKVRTGKKALQESSDELEERKERLNIAGSPISKSNPSSNSRNSRSKSQNYGSSFDDNYDEAGSSPYRDKGRDRDTGRRKDKFDDDYDEPPPRRKPQSNSGRSNDYDDPYDTYDRDTRDDYNGSRGSVKGSPDKHKKWVSQAEYDELSALCDNLLKQQDEIQSDMKSGQTTKRGNGRDVPSINTGRGGPNAGRAKSQQQLHRERPKQVGTFGSSRPKSNQLARNNSSDSTDAPNTSRSTGSTRSGTGPVKVAFGRVIAGSKTTSRLENEQKKVMKSGGAATGKMLMNASEPKGRGDRRGVPPLAPRNDSPERGGFKKMAANARSGGPIVVSYEDDIGGSNSGGRRDNRGTAQSLELNGESEYLKIKGEDVDLISGDQLDRLLVKARGNRRGGGHDR